MPNPAYTSAFMSVPADQVRVPGLPQAGSGWRVIGRQTLSSLVSIFTVSPDTARVLPPATISISLRPCQPVDRAADNLAAQNFTETGYGEDDYSQRIASLLAIGD